MDSLSHSAPENFGNQAGNQNFGNQDFDGDSGGSGDGIAPGQGQSKSSRRRRRKRKGKVGDGPIGASSEGGDTSPQPAPFVMEGESLALAGSAAPAQSQQRRPNPNPNPGGQQPQQGQGQGAGGKRWKKKFRDRDRRPARSENPGNDFRADGSSSQSGFSNPGAAFNNGANYGNNTGGGGGGFKRKGKQGPRKDRSFVGPMDHSYREVNGNFADSPPSTIQINGGGFGRKGGHRHHGDSQPIDHSMPRAIPIPEGAQTHIYFFIEDLFFTAKISEMARKQGVKISFIKNDKDALAELTNGEDENKPALIVFDLNNVNAKPMTLIPKLKAKLKKSVSIIGFLSHLQGDLKAKAVEAGCDAVMPRAAFSQNLPNLLRRYSVEEGEEVNYNQ